MRTVSGQNLKDISGKKFKHLEPIMPISVTGNRDAVWLFMCDCGKTVARRACKPGRDCGCRYGKRPAIVGYKPEYRLILHNVSTERYERMLSDQKNSCGICRKPFTETPRIDHDHSCCSDSRFSCGRCVRGLLCDRCNNGLGRFKDDQNLVRSALAYLRRFNEQICQQ
jgi:hypothetical protein